MEDRETPPVSPAQKLARRIAATAEDTFVPADVFQQWLHDLAAEHPLEEILQDATLAFLDLLNVERANAELVRGVSFDAGTLVEPRAITAALWHHVATALAGADLDHQTGVNVDGLDVKSAEELGEIAGDRLAEQYPQHHSLLRVALSELVGARLACSYLAHALRRHADDTEYQALMVTARRAVVDTAPKPQHD